MIIYCKIIDLIDDNEINIHHLELFYHVVKHGGITAASRRMPYGIQQPAISGQIAQLERSLERRLFHRRPFGLTPAGAKLFGEIESFFSALKELPHQVRGHGLRRLRLAAPATILRDYLPDLLAKYKRRYPDFRLTLREANQAAAEELLQKREIDLAISELEDRPAASVKSVNLVRLPLALVLPKREKARSITDLFTGGRSSQNLISLAAEEVITKQFHAGLKRLRLSWPTAIEVSSLELIDTYVRLGFGVGVSLILPHRNRAGLRLVSLPRFPPVTIAALWLGELSDMAASFLEDVQNIAHRMERFRRR